MSVGVDDIIHALENRIRKEAKRVYVAYHVLKLIREGMT